MPVKAVRYIRQMIKPGRLNSYMTDGSKNQWCHWSGQKPTGEYLGNIWASRFKDIYLPLTDHSINSSLCNGTISHLYSIGSGSHRVTWTEVYRESQLPSYQETGKIDQFSVFKATTAWRWRGHSSSWWELSSICTKSSKTNKVLLEEERKMLQEEGTSLISWHDVYHI